jgi:uncharacterized membrane protein
MRKTIIALAAVAATIAVTAPAQASKRYVPEVRVPHASVDVQECGCELATAETADGLVLTFSNHSGHPQQYVANIRRVYVPDNLPGVPSQRTTRTVLNGHSVTITVLWQDETYIAAAFAAEPDHVGIQAPEFFQRP